MALRDIRSALRSPNGEKLADVLHLGPEPSIRILDARGLRGPNKWSRRPMVRLLVDLGVLERFPSDRIQGFPDRLLAALPGLFTHTCSYGHPGGFARRLHEGTWLGHVAEHVAIELQDQAGSAVTRGKTRETDKPGQYDVVFAYKIESVGLAAGRAAVALVNALVDPGRAEPEALDAGAIIDELRALADRDGLGPSTQAIVDEAHRRGIPVIRLDDRNLVQLGWGVNARRIRATITDGTSMIAAELASDKDEASRILAGAGLPTPPWRRVSTAEAAVQAAKRIGYPVVVKPVDGNHGRGVSLELRSDDAVAAAFETAAAASRRRRAVVQGYLDGRDHRLLVVGGRLVACAERVPAGVVADGRSTVGQLVDATNADPRRGDGHSRQLTRIRVDDAALALLAEHGWDLGSVPPRGAFVRLARTANLSTGGTAVDRTARVHPDVANVAVMAARLLGLDIAGVDVITPDISRPLREVGGGIVEVNAAPGFRMHSHPTVGRPRNVARAVIDHLFPGDSEGRIPIAAVTGTNGKTTTTRMLAHLAAADGRHVGVTTTDGIVVDGWTMKSGDMAGPGSCRVLLGVPTIDVAVLEVARGGILREGLGYDRNDVAIVTNVSGDHLGLDGIETIEQMATVKGVLVEAVPRSGTAVLNADDPLVARMAAKSRGAVALTSVALDPGARGRRAVERHLAGGAAQLGGLVEGASGSERLVVRLGEETLIDVPLRDIPATHGGAAWMNVSNALQAACGALALGIAPALVERGLRTFQTSAENAPGRLNRMNVGGVDVFVDYAHNPAGMRAFGAFLERIRDGRRCIGAFSMPGDRRREDQDALGRSAGEMFDELFVADPNPRGRPEGETARVLMDAAGSGPRARVTKMTYVRQEVDACRAALDAARPGEVVVLFVAHAGPVLAEIEARRSGDGRDARRRTDRGRAHPRRRQAAADSATPSPEAQERRSPRAAKPPSANSKAKAKAKAPGSRRADGAGTAGGTRGGSSRGRAGSGAGDASR